MRTRTRSPGRRASYSEGAAFGGLSFLSVIAVGLVGSVVVARLYGVEALGGFALAWAPVNAVWYLSSAKERPALVRELAALPPGDPLVGGLFHAVLAFSFALTLVVTGLGALAVVLLFEGPLGYPELVGPALFGLGGYLLFANTCFNVDSVLAAFRAGRQLFWIRLHQALAFLVLAVALSFELDTAWGPVAAMVGSYASSLVHRVLAVRRVMPLAPGRAALAAGFRKLPEIVRFGLKMAPGGVADGAANEAATWVIAAFQPVAALGAYNRAAVLGRRFVELGWRINEMLFPTLVERRDRGDGEGYDRALVDTLRYAAAALLLPAAAGGGAAGAIMALYGPGFGEAAGALALLLLAPAVAIASNVQRHVLYAADRPLQGSAAAGIRMAVTVAASVGLTAWLGLTGAALAVLAGYGADLAYMARMVRAELSSPLRRLWPVRQWVAQAGAYAAGFGAAAATDSALPGLAAVVPALAAGALAYAAAFVALGGVGPRDRARLAALRARLRRWRAGGTRPPQAVSASC